MRINILKDEFWWAGKVVDGHFMPFDSTVTTTVDLNRGNAGGGDQFAPLMLSSKGRYVWSDRVFDIAIQDGAIELTGKDIQPVEAGSNLRDAYLAAMKAHFPFSGKTPDELFFKAVQYNTWIELGTNQTTENILNYAKGILAGGLEPGVLMIDGGWQEDYGVFEFNARKVPDPKYLMDELHKLGFKVMLWVSPIVASAGERFKLLKSKGYLCRVSEHEPAVRHWWSGYSAVLDFTNPDAVAWAHEQMHSLMERYGVDGYKFDAGDIYFYNDNDLIHIPTPARDQTTFFNEVGAAYAFNEFRAAYKFGGREIVARLHDKTHTWDGFGLNTLIPHTITQGLCGYAYCCPDMVGGGQIVGTEGLGDIDQELFIRWTQANALMGMMQLSIGPWRILSEENWQIAKKYIQLHAQYGEHFVKLARNAAQTGEPLVRPLCYHYPNAGLETVVDEFLLGDDILVAPVLEKGQRERKVILPAGRWKSDRGEEFDGGVTITESVPLDRLCIYKKIG